MDIKKGQNRIRIIVGIVLVMIPIVTLIYNIIFPPVDGSICSDWRNCSHCSAVIYIWICAFVVIASIISSLISIVLVINLIVQKCREIWVYILYTMPFFILLITRIIALLIEKNANFP